MSKEEGGFEHVQRLRVRSADSRERWVELLGHPRLAVLHFDGTADVIWAGMEVNGAMRSDDGGESWTDLNDNLAALSRQPHLESALLTKDKAEGMLDVHAICVSPAAPETPFLALRMGLFRGEDRGMHWSAAILIANRP